MFRKNLAIAEEDFIYARFCPVIYNGVYSKVYKRVIVDQRVHKNYLQKARPDFCFQRVSYVLSTVICVGYSSYIFYT